MLSGTGDCLYAPARLAAAIIGLIAFGNCPVFAQGFTAAITGTVKDMSGAAVEGAAVSVKHIETGLTRAAQADSIGGYSIPSLPVGEYEVTAEKMGFREGSAARNRIGSGSGHSFITIRRSTVGRRRNPICNVISRFPRQPFTT